MNELTISLTSDEEIEIENQLRDLYILQDRRVKKEEIALMVNEICRSGKPFKAIIAGLNDLKTQDVKKMSFPIIIGAILNHCEETLELKTSCDHCSISGFIIMKDPDGHEFGLACNCSNGDKAERQGAMRWNGRGTQLSRHGMLEKRDKG